MDIKKEFDTKKALERELETSSALAELSQYLLSSTSIEEIAAAVLNSTKKLTGSIFGFVGYIDPKTGYLVTPTLTREVHNICSMDDKEVVFKDFKGLWGWSLIHKKTVLTNSPGDDPRYHGIPEGHIPIERLICVPAVVGNTLMGQISLANSTRDYNVDDIQIVQRFADLLAFALQRKRYEDELLKLSQAVAQTQNAIFITDTDGIVEYTNLAYSQLTGFTKNETLGRPAKIFDRNSVPLETGREIWRNIKSGHNWEGEFRTTRKNGEPFWVFAAISPIFDQKDNMKHFIAILNDITEEKEMAEEREALMKEIMDKNEDIESFTYAVSHDLKSPLVTINGFAEALRDKCSEELCEEGRSHLDRIQNASEKMMFLIEDLLHFSRAGRIEDKKTEIDFAQLVDDALAMLEGHLSKEKIKVVVKPAGAKMWGVRKHLQQVMENLIGNAAKFIGSSNPAPTIEIGARTRAGRSEFYVRDNGIGIKPFYHEKIFKLFQRMPVTESISGSGVGLAFVKKIIEWHDGNIRVESQPGEGSTFIFTLGEKEN